MSDHSDTKPDVEVPEDEIDQTEKPQSPKQKRKMSEKQLANLAKAREKAKVKLGQKKERRDTLRQAEKKLKEMKIKDREDRVQAEINTLRAVNVEGIQEEEPVKYVRKSRKKKKAPKVVYYSSSSEDSSEPELVYRKKKKKPPAHPPTAPRFEKPTMERVKEQDAKHAEDAALEAEYNKEVRRLRKEYVMQQVFPM